MLMKIKRKILTLIEKKSETLMSPLRTSEAALMVLKGFPEFP